MSGSATGDPAPRDADDLAAIDALAAALYAAFRNRGGAVPPVASLRAVFLPDARILDARGGAIQAWTLEAFIDSRVALLGDGRLVDFDERELDARTTVFGHVAARWSLYAKSGVRDGAAFQARGTKSLQCVRGADGWRIAALAWDDAPPGVDLGDRLPDDARRAAALR